MAVTKMIFQKVTTCSDCPHMVYNSNYITSTDSGNYCRLSDKRIMSDFEKEGEAKYRDLVIPSWCLLPDITPLFDKIEKDES